jgi:hypothetical protein
MSEVSNLWGDSEGWTGVEYYSTIQSADIEGDNRAELLARGPAGIVAAKWDRENQEWALLPDGPQLSDAAGWNQPQYYATIQCADIDGDGRAELLARSPDGILVWKFTDDVWSQLPNGPQLDNSAGWGMSPYYPTIQCADIDGDGRAELLARDSDGILAWKFIDDVWSQLPDGPRWSDSAGWNQPQCYSTIQCADIDGDGRAELLARSPDGILVWKFTDDIWSQLPNGPQLGDSAGWNQVQYYATIQCADIDGDSRAELLARSSDGILAWKFTDGAWSQLPDGPQLSDSAGWNQPQCYSTIQCADIDGDGRSNLLARSSAGMGIWKFFNGAWITQSGGPQWSDADDWNQPQYYATIQCADLDGYGQAELFARSSLGMTVFVYNPVYTGKWQLVLDKAASDPAYQQNLLDNPITVLTQEGIDIPADEQDATINLVKFVLRDPPAISPEYYLRARAMQTEEMPYVSAKASWYGLTLVLSSQAVQDVSNGTNIAAALSSAVSLVASSSSTLIFFPPASAIVAGISAYLWGLASVIGLADRGNGVKLLIPWTSFGSFPPYGTRGLVIPYPN